MAVDGVGDKLFFFNLDGDTRKVTCFANELGSLADLIPMVQNKFGDKNVVTANIEFWTTDQSYGVRHKLDSLQDIYDGAIIEIMTQQKRKRVADNQGQQPKRVRTGPRYVVRLRGLPWECTLGDLNEFFDGIELVDAQIIYLSSGRASGEGVVEVGSQEDFEKALGKNNEHIGSRWIEVFKSTGEDIDRVMGRVNATGGNVENVQNSVIRMRGLPFAALESDIIEFFGQASVKPARVHLVREEGLGRPSGVAYAEFSTEEECSAALTCNNRNIGTRYIELFKSTMSDLKATCGYSNSFDNMYNPAMAGVQFGPAYNGFGGGPQFQGDGNHCVKMRGLPYNSNEKDITTFFQEGGVIPTRIHRNPDGGEAYVEFMNGNDAQKAMGRNRAHIGHRYIELFRVPYDEVASIVGLPRGNMQQPQPYYQGGY